MLRPKGTTPSSASRQAKARRPPGSIPTCDGSIGTATHEAAQLRRSFWRPARHFKGGDAVLDDEE